MTEIIIITMKKSEIFQELLKCDADTRSEQTLLKKIAPADLLDTGLPQTFNLEKTQYLQSAIKHSAVKEGMLVLI